MIYKIARNTRRCSLMAAPSTCYTQHFKANILLAIAVGLSSSYPSSGIIPGRGKYIRRRNPAPALCDLWTGGEKIIDISVKYGCDSPLHHMNMFQILLPVWQCHSYKSEFPLFAVQGNSVRCTVKGADAPLDVQQSDSAIQRKIFR